MPGKSTAPPILLFANKSSSVTKPIFVHQGQISLNQSVSSHEWVDLDYSHVPLLPPLTPSTIAGAPLMLARHNQTALPSTFNNRTSTTAPSLPLHQHTQSIAPPTPSLFLAKSSSPRDLSNPFNSQNSKYPPFQASESISGALSSFLNTAPSNAFYDSR